MDHNRIKKILRESTTTDISDFTYNIGDVFTYNELPISVRDEIDICYGEGDDVEDFYPSEQKYKVVLYSYDKLMEWLDRVYGHSLGDEADTDEILQLADDIRKNGLNYPVIFGCEGHHRALAYYHLEKPIPSFQLVR